MEFSETVVDDAHAAKAKRSLIANKKTDNIVVLGSDSSESSDKEPKTAKSAAKKASKPKEQQAEVQAAELIKLGLGAGSRFFRNEDETAFCTFKEGDHFETLQVRSTRFKRFLGRKFFDAKGKPPQSQALTDALNHLEGEALYSKEPPVKVGLRVAESPDGSIIIDLVDEDWQAVEVGKNGWQVRDRSPIPMVRQNGMRPLPLPVRNGDLSLLWNYVNAPTEELKVLMVAWLLAALRPVRPYPVLALQGGQGTGKSFTSRVLRALVDPSTVPLRTLPENERDLLITAKNSWVQAYDNLSGLNNRLSDCLCRLSTGGGSSCRQLHTDTDEILINVERPVIVNGIDDIATRADLQERSLVCLLPKIGDGARQPEQEKWLQFEADRPKILGALLDALCGAIQNLPKTKLEFLPRMADFALWITAAESSLGWASGHFLNVYTANQQGAIETGLQSDSFATAVRSMMNDRPQVTGTVREVLRLIKSYANEGENTSSRSWPNERTLMKRLMRLQGPLSAIGIEYQPGGHTSKGSCLELRKISSLASSSSKQLSLAGLKADDVVTIIPNSDDVLGKVTMLSSGLKLSSAPESPQDKASDDNDANDDNLVLCAHEDDFGVEDL